METQYIKTYSHALGREMECKIYGHGGIPVLFVPCQDGRFFDFESFNMTDTWSRWIEGGKVTVMGIDTMDKETWSDPVSPADQRIRRHEEWVRYVTEEAMPMLLERCGAQKAWVFGCSLGATHAVNLFFRFPERFTGLLALSGIYTAEYGFGSYMDEVVYRNSPVHYLSNMSPDHPYIARYNRNQGIICVGQGAWEQVDTTCILDELFREKGIDVWVDYWGHDVSHDWPWWYKQVAYFMPKLLEG